MYYKKYFSASRALKRGLDAILPPRCPITGQKVESVGAISYEAWKELTFISNPKCQCCGIPFEIKTDPDAAVPEEFLCAECLSTPRPYDRARATFVYDDTCKPMILAFKHADKPQLHTTLAPLLAGTLEEFDEDPANPFILVPVPLHWLRLIKRRYNQAAILANALTKMTGFETWPDALTRTRHTPPQGHMGPKDRHKNVAGAFALNPKIQSKLSGKNIILIDDVHTTGATIEECSKILKAAGAKTVNVLTVARAVRH